MQSRILAPTRFFNTLSRHTPGCEAHITCSTFGISIIPAYSLSTISFMKALIKNQEAAPLSQLFYLSPFHFSFHCNPNKEP